MTMFYLITIIVSLVGMVFVITAKIAELKSGRESVFSRLSVSCDSIFHQYLLRINEFVSKFNLLNFKRILRILNHFLFHIFGTVGFFVSKHHANLKSRLNGKKNLRGKGVVSFFLKDVAESKEERKDNS